MLVPGTANTWTDGVNTWAGNQSCAEAGLLLQPTSPARNAADKGCTRINTYTLQCKAGANDTPPNATYTMPTTFCPNPGPALNQPLLADGSYCDEWYDSSPSLGACQFVPGAIPTFTPSADGTHVFPGDGKTITDDVGAAWSFGATVDGLNYQALRNGTQWGGGFGQILAYCKQTIYLRGDDTATAWYVENATAWDYVGAADPCNQGMPATPGKPTVQ